MCRAARHFANLGSAVSSGLASAVSIIRVALSCLGIAALAACSATMQGVGGAPGASGGLGESVSGRRDAAPFLPGSAVLALSTPGGGSPDAAFNVVFVADDVAFGDLSVPSNFDRFVADATDVIDNGFRLVDGLRLNETLLHFYVLRASGHVSGGACPRNLQMPDEVIERDSLFADAFIILHNREDVRDCADTGTRYGSAGVRREGGVLVRKTGVAVHEALHAVFLLPDEYPENGGMWPTDPPVVFRDRTACEAYRRDALGITTPADCRQLRDFRGDYWWQADFRPFTPDIMDPPSPFDRIVQFGPADWRRARAVMRATGASVVDPAGM
ncbi:MAG: hypothetical protein AAFX08_02685 [Pseudomonadota bacterium]